MPSEPRATNARYVVLRGQDEGRIGVAVDVLSMSEIVGGWWEVLCAACRGRPPRRWSMEWLELEFEEGDRGAYRLDDLEARHG
jgi:hypothetical protein